VEVCSTFWANTFGIGESALKHLRKLATLLFFPARSNRKGESILRWGGQKNTGKEQLVRAYIDTVPRHYSHYNTSSTNEYVDCASSALNWWKDQQSLTTMERHPFAFLSGLICNMAQTTTSSIARTPTTQDYMASATISLRALWDPMPPFCQSQQSHIIIFYL
jgi:hypothetical protein